jgi:hypothetical protein
VSIGGKYITLNATNISTVNDAGSREPMMVRKTFTVAANTSGLLTSLAPATHGIDTMIYEVCVVGWYYTQTSPAVRGVYATSSGYVYVYFSAAPTTGSVTLHLLGIPKAMTGNW